MTDEIAAERLEAWLRGRLPDTVRLGQLRRAPVGQSSRTMLFDARWRGGHGEFVLRVQPGPDGIFLEPDAAREFRVLEALSGSGVAVPRVRWLERDPAVLGAPFFVMDRVEGTVPAGRPSIHAAGWLPTLTPARRRRLWESALAELVAVHAVDWRRSHAFLRPDGDAGLAGHLARTAAWYRWAARGRSFPITDAALRSLFDRLPSVEAGEPVLLWGDARPGNMIFSTDGPAVAAVLDWEVATIGPAAVDLAHWLVFDEFATTACGVDRLPGYPDRAATIARYEQLSGRAPRDLDYFEVLECFFLATTLIRQTDAAVHSGAIGPETRMAHDNTVTQMLARRLGLPVPEPAADYLRHRRAAAGKGK